MNSKAITVALSLFVLGLLGGYLTGTLTLQSQLTDLNLEYSNVTKENLQLHETINGLRAEVSNPKRIAGLESNTGHPIISTHSTPGWAFQGWSIISQEVPPISVQIDTSNYD